jgi:uncharacterized sulfatase
LLIVLDTLRADRLSCYGYSRETSPHLDAFAEDAVLFQRPVSPAQWTIPAHASIFTGEYPSTHMTNQIYDKHSPDQPLLAELLGQEGYRTVSFCNNPLLGVVENDLDRGFEEVYNYGGALPNRPAAADSRPRIVGRVMRHLGRLMGRVTTPIQDLFARHDWLLNIALHPRIVNLWHANLNFKGDTSLSIRDMLGMLRTHRKKGDRPLFTFVNLMETHLPYRPPQRFIQRFAPYYRNDREARDFMERYNLEHYRWMIPLEEPLNEVQDRVLNDLYDAEIAYQDHLLRRLFEYLDQPEVRDNTLVIITSDHGEGLNNHNFVGHSLVAYDDLVRVPLIVRYPRAYPQGKRVDNPVSTRRIFHAALQAAGIDLNGNGSNGVPVDVDGLSLSQALNGSDPEEGIVYTEAYTPDTLIALMKSQTPAMIETFRCNQMRRAVYQDAYKLITVGEDPDELFDVIADPAELDNLIDQEPKRTATLDQLLTTFRADAEARRPANWEAAQLRLDEDEELMSRLRGLGYVE